MQKKNFQYICECLQIHSNSIGPVNTGAFKVFSNKNVDMELCDDNFQSLQEACLHCPWPVGFVSLSECCFCRIRWPLCPGGTGRRRARGHRPEKCRLASSAPPIPGLPALLSHHLLSPRLQHPPEALGEDYQRWEQAEHSLLQYGKAAVCPPVPVCLGQCDCPGWGWSVLLMICREFSPTTVLPLNRVKIAFFLKHHPVTLGN